MATLTTNPAELIVSIDDQKMVNKIKAALKLMKGVGQVRLRRKTLGEKILTSPAYQEAMSDVANGRVYEAESVDEMFKE